MSRHIALLCSLLFTTALLADDALKNAVDPYDPADQRVKFFKAAGSDNELDAKEFAGDAKAGNNLVQSFEKWEQAAAFDKDAKGTLDWFELDAYRQAMRKAVMTAFDKDKDGKLAGEERDAALKALADGKLSFKPDATPAGSTPPPPLPPAGSGTPTGTPAATNPPTATGPATTGPAGRPGNGNERPRAWGRFEPSPEQVKKYDKDGDGKLNDDERKTMRDDMRKGWEKAQLDRWDKDKDGKLSDAERSTMNRQQRIERMPPNVREFMTRNFDSDGNGEIDDKEWESADKFRKEFEQTTQKWQTLAFDLDGDGKVTDEERAEAMQDWAPVGAKMFQNMRKRADANGDGNTTPEEQQAFQKKFEGGMTRYMAKFEKQADADKDGKLSETERAAMLKGMDTEVRDRVKQYDANKNGRLDPDEGEKLISDMTEEFMKD